MFKLSLFQLLRALAPQIQTPAEDILLNGACIDSRTDVSGKLFVAFRGEKTDGHNFVDRALANGASMALIQHPIESAYPVLDLKLPRVEWPASAPYSLLVPDSLLALQKLATSWRQQFQIPVIGITGSVGKSSSKEAIATLLASKHEILKSSGNHNNEIGLPLTLLSLTSAHQLAVLEMGFYVAGEIQLLCDIARPETGVITNIGTVHAQRAGSIEAIARGKAELIENLPKSGLAILNYDDPHVRAMAALSKAPVLSYGLDPQADLWADRLESHALQGITCTCHYQGQSKELSAPLPGKHSVYTLLRATAVALHYGFSWEEIGKGLALCAVPSRSSLVRAKNGALLMDDSYNASPDSTLAALDLLAEMPGRKVAVLGDMLELGQYATEGHQRIGLRASQVTAELVFIGPLSQIAFETAQKQHFQGPLHHFNDAESALPYLQSNLKIGDIALVKGSHSMHLETIINHLEKKA